MPSIAIEQLWSSTVTSSSPHYADRPTYSRAWPDEPERPPDRAAAARRMVAADGRRSGGDAAPNVRATSCRRAGGRPGRPKALGTLGTFAYHPDLAQAFLSFNGHILYGTTLTLRQHEILVLRVAAVLVRPTGGGNISCTRDDAGLSDEDIARIAFGPEAPFLDPVEQAMLRAVDELLGDGKIGDTTWTALAEHFDERQLLDLIFTVGTYTILDWMADSIGFELEPDILSTAVPGGTPTE